MTISHLYVRDIGHSVYAKYDKTEGEIEKHIAFLNISKSFKVSIRYHYLIDQIVQKGKKRKKFQNQNMEGHIH